MKMFASTLAALPPALAVLTCLAAAPASAQSYTFTSDGTGTYFTDTLTMGQPHPVDFSAKTSGRFEGQDSIMTITGYGAAGVVYTYTNSGQSVHENTDLTTSSVLLQDAVSGATIFSAAGPLHYELITPHFGTNTLTLTGTVVDTASKSWSLDFFKDENRGIVTTRFTQPPVPEPASSVDLSMMLGLTLAMLLWSARKRHRSVRNDIAHG